MKTALLADHQIITQRITKRSLSDLGLQVKVAGSKAELFELLSKNRFDVLFLRLDFEEADGFALAHEIRAKGMLSVNIVGLDTEPKRGHRKKAKEAGLRFAVSYPLKAADVSKLKKWGDNLEVPRFDAVIPAESDVLVDRDRLDTLAEVSGENFVDLLAQEFFSSFSKKLDAIDHACNDGDYGVIERLAYDLKSDAATLGARRLAILCESIEKQARKKNSKEVKLLLVQLEPLFRETRSVLRRRA